MVCYPVIFCMQYFFLSKLLVQPQCRVDVDKYDVDNRNHNNDIDSNYNDNNTEFRVHFVKGSRCS